MQVTRRLPGRLRACVTDFRGRADAPGDERCRRTTTICHLLTTRPRLRPPTSTRPSPQQQPPPGSGGSGSWPSLTCRPRSSRSPSSRPACSATWRRPWTSRPGRPSSILGRGRGGPGLWLARQAGALLVGVDFSPVRRRPGRAPGGAVGLAGEGNVHHRRPHPHRASAGQRRRGCVHRRLPLRPRRSRRRGPPDPAARPAADVLVQELQRIPRIGPWTAGAAVADYSNDFTYYPYADLAVRTWAKRAAPSYPWPAGAPRGHERRAAERGRDKSGRSSWPS